MDEATRAHYFALGDDYRIKPEITNTRQQKVALVVLFVLAMTFAAIGLYGYKIDSLQLQILGFCGAMPTFLGFLLHLDSARSCEATMLSARPLLHRKLAREWQKAGLEPPTQSQIRKINSFVGSVAGLRRH
ncbi:MAG TPA: hypothetical protein VN742_00220 [Candidatus Binataceae bacterium]|nr:hypothetical protein [Candidatus Binataceae bacterium]